MLTAVLNYVARQPNKHAVCVSWKRTDRVADTYMLFADTYGARSSVPLWANAPASDLPTLKAIAVLANEFAFLNTSTVNAKAIYAMAYRLIRSKRYSESKFAISFEVTAAFDSALRVLATVYPSIVSAAQKSILTL